MATAVSILLINCAGQPGNTAGKPEISTFIHQMENKNTPPNSHNSWGHYFFFNAGQLNIFLQKHS